MLVFLTSDKGGTGRSVTGCNVGYRSALQGADVCYFDFDFGSPTSGAIFNVDRVARGVEPPELGLHSYFTGDTAEPARVNIWRECDRVTLRDPPGAGKLVLFPGDAGGGEFPTDAAMVERCVELFLRAEEEFDVCMVDLSAGRSWATQMVLAATAEPSLANVVSRWLVFHRWTSQHIIAAHGLVYGKRGLLATREARRHDLEKLTNAIRFVRTAVSDPNSPELAGLRAEQVAWLQRCNQDLQDLAKSRGLGRTSTLGTVQIDPLLQWREQLISDNDAFVFKIANPQTAEAFEVLARSLTDDEAWEIL